MPGLRHAMAVAVAGLLAVAPAGVGSTDSASVARGGHGHCVEPRTGSEVCVTPGDAELRSWPDPADLPTPPDVPVRPDNL
ncbi:hypothetical protein [Mycobacteroides saopaulense]|uniref:Uncharacterized protein n=1 Tax=Mycobacteroides saopaulense TaxID=1578165 RepID=A0A1S1JG12_9MYCO|nr:hypothetical protein [Mycobacteroides saopaulense]ALR10933.1 hypothetical protein MYCSP_05015 [Mycobacteroides saopaulense]OHT82386.1 hypothetical protein BKG68_20505 [Mycobacteroides saopaulense]OHU01770.1 hypothetical protein BKG73_24145 [Mycobacteroides saopaulense]ORB58901.1 hypothetical protein BST43_08725 [Mycobacteroides saopaulense]